MTLCDSVLQAHYENMPMQYKEMFKIVKNVNFPLKHFDIFLIFAQNIDCGYTVEPPRRKKRYTSAYPGFTIQKWGLRGYSLHGHVFLMYNWILLVYVQNQLHQERNIFLNYYFSLFLYIL